MGTILAKSLLLGYNCKNCIYYTTPEKVVSASCVLEHYPDRLDLYQGHNLCPSYAPSTLQDNIKFMRAIMLRKSYVTFNDIKYFIEMVEKYKDD